MNPLEMTSLLHSGLGDSSLLTIGWVGDDETDLVIDLQLPEPMRTSEGKHPMLRLRFNWVTELTIDMDFTRYVGAPLLYEATFTRLPNSQWRVGMTFGGQPDGALSFTCNQIRGRFTTREDARHAEEQREEEQVLE